jgi:hypothetical protein
VTRAVRVWAALGEGDRDFLRRRYDHDDALAPLLDALDFDLADHEALTRAAAALDAEPYQAFLITKADAGPERVLECFDCHTPIRVEPMRWFLSREHWIWLGTDCYEKRLLHNWPDPAVPGDQLQAFPAPQPIRED